MKTNNLSSSALLIFAMLISYSGFTQDDNSYAMSVVVYMDVKVGMEKDFEEAVLEHNKNFHNAAPNLGHLSQIMSGSDAGTYAWIMAPCTFTDLDGMKLGDDHDKHWDDKVVPSIKKYGAQEYWKFNEKLSYQPEGDRENAFSEIWIVDLKRGDYYRFKALMGMINDAFEKQGTGSIRVYDNQFNGNDGRDVALVFDMENLAQMDEDSSIKNTYEELHGDGSWDTMLDEWSEITVAINSQLWRSIK